MSNENFEFQKNKKNSCEICNYICSKPSDLHKHFLSSKHKRRENAINSGENAICLGETVESKKLICVCNKAYNHYPSLWRHQKQCQVFQSENNDSHTENNTVALKTQILQPDNLALLLIETVKQNQELQKQSYEFQMQTQSQNQEFQMKMFEMMKGAMGTQNAMVNSNNTNINSNNKFNLQFFLNETCKDAMNIKEFIDSIKVSFEDVEFSGMHGFTEGVSRIFLRELNKLDVCKRPIHCSDLKREVFHIKNENNTWENERSLIFKIINLITRKNMFILKDWSEANPLCMDTQTAIHDRFVQLKIACFGPYDNEVEEKEFNKIIAKVAKATVIDKSKKKM